MRIAALAGLALVAATVLLPSASAAPSSPQAAYACVNSSLDPPAVWVEPETCRAIVHELVDYVFDLVLSVPGTVECLLGPHPYYCLNV